MLVVKKPGGVGPYAGMYLPPGGGVNQGERIDDAARRELYEETGIKVTNLKRVVFDDAVVADWQGNEKHFVGLLYTADYESGELGATEGDDDDLEDMRWCSREEVQQLPLSPPLRTLLEQSGYLDD